MHINVSSARPTLGTALTPQAWNPAAIKLTWFVARILSGRLISDGWEGQAYGHVRVVDLAAFPGNLASSVNSWILAGYEATHTEGLDRAQGVAVACYARWQYFLAGGSWPAPGFQTFVSPAPAPVIPSPKPGPRPGGFNSARWSLEFHSSYAHSVRSGDAFVAAHIPTLREQDQGWTRDFLHRLGREVASEPEPLRCGHLEAYPPYPVPDQSAVWHTPAPPPQPRPRHQPSPDSQPPPPATTSPPDYQEVARNNFARIGRAYVTSAAAGDLEVNRLITGDSSNAQMTREILKVLGREGDLATTADAYLTPIASPRLPLAPLSNQGRPACVDKHGVVHRQDVGGDGTFRPVTHFGFEVRETTVSGFPAQPDTAGPPHQARNFIGTPATTGDFRPLRPRPRPTFLGP